VRFLFTFAGGTGHFRPTLPFARQLVGRGHQVAYACQEAMLPEVAAEVAPDGMAVLASGGPTLRAPDERRPLVTIDRAAQRQSFHYGFAGRTARRRAARLVEVIRDWQPDLVVRDEGDFGAAVAAETCGLPHAAVIVLAAGMMTDAHLSGPPLDALRVEHGLTADPDGLMPHRYLTLVPAPPSFRHPADPLPATAHHVRPAVVDGRGAATSETLTGSRSDGRTVRPTVYVTLGTIFNQESGDLFTRILAGLSALPVDVIVTVGPALDPSELGRQPPHIRVERFLPLGPVLASCAAVVSHAGSGTLLGALAFGLPSVLFPLGADQPYNADRAVDIGVARALDAVTAHPGDVAAAVGEILDDPGYREAAEQIRNEILALPGADHAADLLEQLAEERQPIRCPG
jgi:UDP:flavonoid glycosyltransferase YjiC (YdhE family)